ncbi:RNA polymerase sigma factor [Nocardia sp. NPDC003482]
MNLGDPGSPAARERTSPVDSATFSAFYREQLSKLVRYLISAGARQVDAVEIAQEAMGEAWRRWANIEYPKTWVWFVARRKLADRARCQTNEQLVSDISEQSPLRSENLTELIMWEQHQDLLRELQALSVVQREIMIMTLEGFTPAEIAEELRMPIATVRSYAVRARQKLVKNRNDPRSEES